MTRILAAIFSLVAIGAAAAQPPVDYTLQCTTEVEADVFESVVIGTASYVDGQLHVAVLDGATCEEPSFLSVAQNADLTVTFTVDADGVLTVAIDDVADETTEAMEGVAIEVPQQAIDGKVGATENRAAAAERRGQGRENAAAKRGERQPEPPVDPEPPLVPVDPDLPVVPVDPDLPVMPVEAELIGQPELPVVPGLPEAAGNGRRP